MFPLCGKPLWSTLNIIDNIGYDQLLITGKVVGRSRRQQHRIPHANIISPVPLIKLSSLQFFHCKYLSYYPSEASVFKPVLFMQVSFLLFLSCKYLPPSPSQPLMQAFPLYLLPAISYPHFFAIKPARWRVAHK